MSKKTNYWYNHHETLGDKQKVKAREKIEKECLWSTTTFYEKKKNPVNLSPVEKKAVVKAYGKTLADFFPEPKPIPA